MKNLPIGIQSFSEIHARNCVYVDKTRQVHQLVTTGKHYFFSRPRRFGKSLLVSTLKELYRGNKAVFEGLWIEGNWDWTKKHPVVHISFDDIDYRQMGIEVALVLELKKNAEKFGIDLSSNTYKSQFKELIEETAKKHGKVVVLIDEYDKPIIDFWESETLDQAKANRDVLREFYGVLKNADEHLELVFITGITKFSKVSLFSHLNNLTDITIDDEYASLAGYTQDELEFYFDEYLHLCAEKLQISRPELLQHLKTWYDGYSWDGITELYNPFGTLNFLHKKAFFNHWFSTGSPKFLIEQMREQQVFWLENVHTDTTLGEKHDFDQLDIVALFFQTGYLTIKKLDRMTGEMVLDYPNKEVRESMYQYIISDLARNPRRTNTAGTVQDIRKAFLARDLAGVREIIESLLADLPAETFKNQTEGLYHGLVHIVFNYLGQYMQSEVHSAKGRADAVVTTPTDVYIFEFKFNKTAREALEQIHQKRYADKYRASGKTITGIGVNFNSEERVVDGWEEMGV